MLPNTYNVCTVLIAIASRIPLPRSLLVSDGKWSAAKSVHDFKESAAIITK